MLGLIVHFVNTYRYRGWLQYQFIKKFICNHPLINVKKFLIGFSVFSSIIFPVRNTSMPSRASAEKFPGGRGQRKKDRKNSIKRPKNTVVLLSLFHGATEKKTEK